ncbi:hypothetical protein [Sphingopyxis fribergensis]
MKAGWAWIVVALTACSSPASETVEAPEETRAVAAAAKPVAAPGAVAAEAPITLAPDGLAIAGTKRVAFAIARSSAEQMAGKALGEPLERGSSSECGAGTIDYTTYKGDLQLTFQDDKFVGWTINAGQSLYKTAKGIGIGSPRQSLDAAYPDVTVEDSSLGLLFGASGFVGTLDQDGIEGIVTGIWAGTVCLID